MGSVSPSSKHDAETDVPTTNPYLTALIKGSGPSGLAAALSLAQLDYKVTVVEKRSWRPSGSGRKNMVALRPDALRILDGLGALKHLVESGALTDMVEGTTIDEWDAEAGVFDWGPGFLRFPHRYGENETKQSEDDVPEYQIPAKIWDQLPSSYVNLGDLEDALLQACKQFENVKVLNASTVELKVSKNTNAYAVTLISDIGTATESRITLPYLDLIVCASGKSDTALAAELGFTRSTGVRIDDDALPSSNPRSRDLRLSEEGPLESQQFSVFGIRNPGRRMGDIYHLWRKGETATNEPIQPLCEIEMTHKGVSHCLLHLPRGMDATDSQALEQYLVGRVNAKLGMEYHDFEQMKDEGVLVAGAGDPLRVVVVETSTAPRFVFGSNVVLVGDAAMCCSPSSGIGADIGVSLDSRNVRQLGEDLVSLRGLENKDTAWEDALDRFNRRKAEAAVIWSQASRKFYISRQEAEDILEQVGAARAKRVATK